MFINENYLLNFFCAPFISLATISLEETRVTKISCAIICSIYLHYNSTQSTAEHEGDEKYDENDSRLSRCVDSIASRFILTGLIIKFPSHLWMKFKKPIQLSHFCFFTKSFFSTIFNDADTRDNKRLIHKNVNFSLFESSKSGAEEKIASFIKQYRVEK